ncbi:hypothetical protein V5O48_000564 [Marasmius crinis-equi]|uniref:Uncharacterized protein n=1 Tax=Marasmius crinis-equi TaxID=585013 RepID=A0ABR3G1H7_9AGAR
MQAVYYSAPNQVEFRSFSIPDPGDDEVLLKVTCCGICGSDHMVVEGHFHLARFPLIPGHEVVGRVAKLGKNVQGFSEGDRCVVDPITRCYECSFCRRGAYVQCERTSIIGVSTDGGFSSHIVVHSQKLHKIRNLSDEDATLIEPASCAVHTVEQLALPPDSEVLVIGAGPSGILLSQILKCTGVKRVVLASNKGIKMDIAKQVGAAHEYVEIDRQNPEEDWKKLGLENSGGFRGVVEATGSVKVLNKSLDFVTPGGTLVLYGLYGSEPVRWSAPKIFADEIKIIGTIGQHGAFPKAVEYLDGGKVNVKGMISRVYTHSDFQTALHELDNKSCMKIAVKPDPE